MTNNVCICGKSHKNKPIVITVTACKNRHGHKNSQCQKECPSGASSKLILESERGSCIEPYSTNSNKCYPIPAKAVEEQEYTDDATEHIFYDTKSKHVIQEDNAGTKTVIESYENIGKKTKDISVNAPSTVTLQLPLLNPRYHGPGCALEVCVLEKHDGDCDYKKTKNESRNPVDDKVGSYEVIGRIKFKTCTPLKDKPKSQIKIKTTEKEGKPPNQHLPDNDPMVLFSFPGNHAYSLSLVEYNKEQGKSEIQNVVSKSSECITCSNFNKNEEKFQICYETKGNNKLVLNESQNGVEELFFYGKSCNRYVQMEKLAKRKWYHYLLPCLYGNEDCMC